MLSRKMSTGDIFHTFFRLKEQLKRKVLTPVRRSVRVRRSVGLPDFLRSDNCVLESPGEVEEEIVEGN